VRHATTPRANYLVMGCPASRKVTKRNPSRRHVATSHARYFGGDVGDDRYALAGVNRSMHVALAFNVERSRTDIGVTTVVHPRGMSGGAIWSAPRAAELHPLSSGKLVAIFIDYRKGERLFIGTRIGVHLGLIQASWPDAGAALRRQGLTLVDTQQQP